MRVVLALLDDRELTTTKLARELPDVSAASLYRHVAALVEADVLIVVREQRVRGAVERTYKLRPEFQLSPELTLANRKAAANMSPAEQRAAFGVFAAGLIAAYDGYLAGPDPDVVSDNVGYRTRAVYADSKDRRRLTKLFDDALKPLDVEKSGKQRVLITTVIIPTSTAD